VHCLSWIAAEAETSATVATLLSLFPVLVFEMVDILRGEILAGERGVETGGAEYAARNLLQGSRTFDL
jgi:hypothetical protein